MNRRINSRIRPFLFPLASSALVVAVIACSTDDTPQSESAGRSTSELADAPRIDTVAELVTQRGTSAALGDAPAELAFERVSAIQKGGLKARPLAVFRLAAPDASRLTARTHEIGLAWIPTKGGETVPPPDEPGTKGGPFAKGDTVRIVGDYQGGTWALQYNQKSGTEHFFDGDAFHVGKGAITSTDMNAFIDAARSFADRVRSPGARGGTHVYKTRRYMNGEDGDGAPVTEEVYQVAVAFGSDIEGVPVIGSGGKVSVHLANGMKPVSYESSIAEITEERGRVAPAQLLTANDAEARAWATLRASGLDATTHTITSRQFGYVRRGRRNVQSLIAPSYAFFFTPAIEGAKKRVEVVSAVVDEGLRAELEADEAADAARIPRTNGPDSRPAMPAP